MTTSIGRLGAQSAVRRWTMDEVTFTYVVDGQMSLRPGRFLPSFPDTYWQEHPEALDDSGGVPMSAGGLLVERDGLRILVDAGLGAMNIDVHYGTFQGGALLQTLQSIGLRPDDIDVLALTHIHLDHTGLAFVDAEDGSRTAAFPSAAYVMSRREWEPLVHGTFPADQESVVQALLRHPKLTLIDDGGSVATGMTALVTPGHTPGHTSYVVTSSSGRRLVVFGDVFHSPAQLAHPEWGSAPDSDEHLVREARSRVLTELLAPDTYAFAFHFGDQSFGRVVIDDGRAAWEPIPTRVL